MPHLLALVPPPPVAAALRSLGSFDELGPHITVKAQPGLDDERRSSWLPRLRRAVFGFGPVTVQLGPVGTFGDDVVFLDVLSERIHELHRLLVDVVDPPADEAARHFELDDWHPHLTVPLGPGADADQLRAAVDALAPLPPFTVTALWVCRQEASGRCVRDAPLGLHRRTAA